jgi:hypothetical protein
MRRGLWRIGRAATRGIERIGLDARPERVSP